MVKNQLKQIENNLRYIAKRNKNITFSLGLALMYLMLGVNAFSEEVVSNIESQVASKQEIGKSTDRLSEVLREIKSENEKKLKGAQLELVQLMEQGDQVVKSPWSSWQFGMNYTYSKWSGSYKGHGDKKKYPALVRNTSPDPLAKFVAGTATASSYGATDLALVTEPSVEIEVSAGIRPKDVNKKAPTFKPSSPAGALPPFEPKIIAAPAAPIVNAPDISEPSPLVFGKFGSSISSEYYMWESAGQTMMKQVSLFTGKIKGTSGSGAFMKGVTGEAGYHTTNGATLQKGTLKAGTPVTPSDGMNASTTEILYGIRDSAFMEWSKDIEITWFGKFGKPLIYMETGSNNGLNNTSLDHLYAGGAGPVKQELYDEISTYKTQSGLKELDGGSQGINFHNNKGKIYLGNTDAWYNATTVLGARRFSVLNNEGTITGLNIHNGMSGENGSEKQVVFFNSPDYDSTTPQRWIFGNGKSGKINMYGKQSLVMYYTSNNGTRQRQNETAFINNGEINLYGIESSGVMISGTEQLKAESGFYLNKPVNIYSDSSRGVYIAGDISQLISDTQAIARVHIGKAKNDTAGVDWTDIETNVTTNIKSNGNDTTGAGNTINTVDGAIGIMYTHASTGAKIQAPDLTLEKFSRKGLGILVSNGKLTVANGNIYINGGEKNIGITTKGISGSAGGDIDYTGNIIMGGSSLSTAGGNEAGEGNIGIFATDGKTVNLTGNLITYNAIGKTKDGVGAFAEKAATVKLKGDADIQLEAGITGNNTGIYAKGTGSVVEIGDQAANTSGKNATSKSKISIDGKNKKLGTALFAGEGGIIKANGSSLINGLDIDVKNGSVAIAAVGASSKVEAKYSTISYDGEGYALYSDGPGSIDVTGSKIKLYGKATGFEKNVGGTFNINLTNTNFEVFSNDVTIANLRGVPSLNLNGLNTSISGYISGLSHSAGTDPITGKVYNQYRVAAVDGLSSYNLNRNLDKSLAVDDKNSATDDYVFTRRLAVQRAKVNLKSGFNVKAVLSGDDLTAIGEKIVVGLAMNSSSYAANVDETQINLEGNTTVTADRTDSGAGAVGLFINYGKANVASNATINVEKESNAVNSGAVGIYSVNGSVVNSEGTINVGGKDSIGILGLAYREDTAGNPKINEFGGKPGEGTVSVNNAGAISLDGVGATGIFIKNNNSTATVYESVAHNETKGLITLSGDKAVGMLGEKSILINAGTIDIQGQESTGMFAKNASAIMNDGTIKIAASTIADKPNIGMFTEDQATEIINSKDIIGGDNTYAIYGKTVVLNPNAKIKVGDNSVGIFSNGEYAPGLLASNIYLHSNSEIEIGEKESVGVFTTGKNQIITADSNMKIGNGSYGYVIRGTGTKLSSNNTNGITFGEDTVFIYSADTTGSIENRTKLTSTGSKNYALYSAGNVKNLADIDFSSGEGNVAIYSISGGTATNGVAGVIGTPTIKVSKSNTKDKFYGIGMAAGYTDDNGVTKETGNIVNYGTIKVEKDNGIGMYATGSGSTAINNGLIELSGKNTVGMYLDNGAVGENHGTIRTIPNPTNDGIIGVVALNGAIIKNYGNIIIQHGSNLTGVYLAKGKYDTSSTGTVTGGIIEKQQSNTGKQVAGVEIVAPGNGTATIKRNGKVITPTYVDTVLASPSAPKVKVGTTELDLKIANLGGFSSMARASEIGMYVDTSGINYTNPIKGLEHLTALKKVNLIFGPEASRYTDSKNIKVGENILKPYNDVITALSSGGGKKFGMNSSSLTWIATGTQGPNDLFNAVYLVKIPYTAFAKDKDTYNFLDGLEQRYGVDGVGTREKELFNKLNNIGKGEPALFAQAVDEMKGHQYANIGQRLYSTSQILENEFEHLRKDLRNVSKDSNKIKTFGLKGEYKSESAGIIDYKNNAYGVAYIHENEDIKLGKSVGWYAGIVENKFKFKDLGNSKEEHLQTKLGLYKSIPFDDNNSLNWTVSGDIFIGYNKMNRRFLIVDEIFQAKSKYYNYGFGLKNEIAKEFRLTESFSVKPYAGLKLEYGRMSKIKEKSGEMKLEVKANDYISVKPEIGGELVYKTPTIGGNFFNASLGVAYVNELGRVANLKNKARVADTKADWYNLRGEKEDRRGNIKTDLSLGWDNAIFGVTANIGYDTKGKNKRAGLGLRVVF